MSITIIIFILTFLIMIPPMAVYITYKKQLNKYNTDIVRQNGKKC